MADIAWFATTHVNVVGNSKAGTAGIMSEADSDVRSNVSEMLSFSTTFNSGPCIASFILAFLQLSLENSLTHRAPDPLKGTAPGLGPHFSTVICSECHFAFCVCIWFREVL